MKYLMLALTLLLSSHSAFAEDQVDCGRCITRDGDSFKQQLANSMNEQQCRANGVIGYSWVSEPAFGRCITRDGDSFKQQLANSMNEQQCRSNEVIGYRWIAPSCN